MTDNLSMFHKETCCGIPIIPVKTHGVMEVYERLFWRSFHLPKYCVFHKNGRWLENFRTKRKAMTWAKKNRKG